MRITGVGVNRAMKNLMATKAAKEERQDKKEAVIMDLLAKYGRPGLAKLFPGEDVSTTEQDIYKAPGVDSSEITEGNLDEVPDDIAMFSQTSKEINAMKALTKPINEGGYGLGIETVTSFYILAINPLETSGVSFCSAIIGSSGSSSSGLVLTSSTIS